MVPINVSRHDLSYNEVNNWQNLCLFLCFCYCHWHHCQYAYQLRSQYLILTFRFDFLVNHDEIHLLAPLQTIFNQLGPLQLTIYLCV